MSGQRHALGTDPLWIVGVGSVSHDTLETAADGASGPVAVDARVHPDPVGVSGFDGDVEPYHGLDLARYARRESGRETVVAVTDADIAKPRGEPAFGLAMRGGSVGIVSTARLGEPGDGRFADRLRTVVAQHVGYMVGLDACRTETCLFNVADSPADLDHIGPAPCDSCREELDEMVPTGEAAQHGAPATSAQSGDPPGASGGSGTVGASAHDLIAAGRFWLGVGGYLLSLFVTALVVVWLLDTLPGVGLPESDGALWVFAVTVLGLAYYVYRRARGLVEAAVRRLLARVGGTTDTDT